MDAHYNDIQAALDECGGECWTVNKPGEQVTEMYRSADGRGAICHGGDSAWGEWITGPDGRDLLMLDEHAEDGSAIYYTTSGEQVQ